MPPLTGPQAADTRMPPLTGMQTANTGMPPLTGTQTFNTGMVMLLDLPVLVDCTPCLDTAVAGVWTAFMLMANSVSGGSIIAKTRTGPGASM